MLEKGGVEENPHPSVSRTKGGIYPACAMHGEWAHIPARRRLASGTGAASTRVCKRIDRSRMAVLRPGVRSTRTAAPANLRNPKTASGSARRSTEHDWAG